MMIFPIGKCAVQCNTTCDYSLMGNGLEARRFKIPTFQLAVPIRHTQESVQDYAADEIKMQFILLKRILEKNLTGKLFFSSMKVFNQETEQLLEWFELSRTDYPQIIADNLALYRYGVYQAAGGRNKVFGYR